MTRPADFIIIEFDLCVFRTALRERRVFLNRLLDFSRIKGKILKEDIPIFSHKFRFPMSNFILKIPKNVIFS